VTTSWDIYLQQAHIHIPNRKYTFMGAVQFRDGPLMASADALYVLLAKEPQSNIAWFNHAVYLEILEEFMYGRNSIAALYPHKFHPFCPILSMVLVANMVSTLDYIGSEAYHHCSVLSCLGSMKQVFTKAIHLMNRITKSTSIMRISCTPWTQI